jgi:hypothetical protein
MTYQDPRGAAPDDEPGGQARPGIVSGEEFARPRLKGLSELLADAAEGDSIYITTGELVERLSARGLAPVVLAMGLLNIVTIIPGSSTIMGLPLVFLGISLMIGARRLWLPQKFRDRAFDRARLKSMIDRIIPYVQKLERLAHPRYWPGFDYVIDRAFGAFVFVLALCISLPIPFGNTMPAISIILVSLGFMARDGLWVVAGLFAATLAVGVIIGVAGAITLAGSSILGF